MLADSTFPSRAKAKALELRGIALIAFGLVIVAFGLFMLVGGIRLITLGGSWYFALAGIGFVAAGVLTMLRRPLGTVVYLAVLAATVVWSVWDAGLAFWPLFSRLFALAALAFPLLLLMPAFEGQRPVSRRPAYVLAGLIAVALGATLYTALQPQPVQTADGATRARSG